MMCAPGSAFTWAAAGNSWACDRILPLGARRSRTGLGQRTGLFDGYHITLIELIVLIMRMVFLGDAHHLAQHRVLNLALDQHGDCLVHLVADDGSGQRTFQIRCTHCCTPFSVNTVFTRAMLRRTLVNWLVLLNCWVATCIRRPNCSLPRDNSSCCSSATDLFFSSLAFMITPLLV